MDTSTFLAQLFGLLYTVIGVSIFMDSLRFRQLISDMQKANPLTLYLAGVTSLVVGFSIITFHNVWTPDWRGLITLIGWIALAKGVLMLLQPSILLKNAVFWQNKLMTAGAIVLLLGLFLGYHGFAG